MTSGVKAERNKSQLKSPSRAGYSACWLALGLTLCACEQETKHELTLQVGAGQITRITKISGHAQYLEIPGQSDQLKIVLASYPVSCNQFRPPQKGDVLLTITVEAEPQKIPISEPIPWNGPEKSEEQPGPTAMPYVRLFEDARALPPGGSMTLKKLERQPHGIVEGELKFSDAGEGEAATAALLGSFSVRLCQAELDPLRSSPEVAEKEPAKK